MMMMMMMILLLLPLLMMLEKSALSSPACGGATHIYTGQTGKHSVLELQHRKQKTQSSLLWLAIDVHGKQVLVERREESVSKSEKRLPMFTVTRRICRGQNFDKTWRWWQECPYDSSHVKTVGHFVKVSCWFLLYYVCQLSHRHWEEHATSRTACEMGLGIITLQNKSWEFKPYSEHETKSLVGECVVLYPEKLFCLLFPFCSWYVGKEVIRRENALCRACSGHRCRKRTFSWPDRLMNSRQGLFDMSGQSEDRDYGVGGLLWREAYI